MVTITYQVIFNDECLFENEIILLLMDTFKKEYDDFTREDIESMINIKYICQIEENKFLVGFQVITDINGIEIVAILNSFNENLIDSEKLSHTLKFYDENLYYFLSELYKMLFEIEMKLREAISLIFIDRYQSDYYNLLRDINLIPRFEGKTNLNREDSQKKMFLSKRFENEFFHILFSDYEKLTNLRSLKQDDLYLIAEISNNFNEFKQNILNRGIRNPHYLNFINNVKEVLRNIERIRNCVAHNRSLSDDDQQNYQTYFEEANKYINDFFTQIETEENE